MSEPILNSDIRASSTIEITHSRLGPLSQLPGTWVGQGFNLISVPNFKNNNQPLPFILKLNAFREILTFNSMGGPIPNRGSSQVDTFFVGLHYLQQISDATTSEALHIEPGMWLNLPATTDPLAPPSLARLATIPHGDSLMALGALTNGGEPFDGKPSFVREDPTPFTLDGQGKRINDSNAEYLAQFHNPKSLPAGITEEIVNNPNILLKTVVDSQVVLRNTVLQVSSNPIGGIGGIDASQISPAFRSNGMLNIPFVDKQANANSFASTFWIEEVENALDPSSPLLQLQYSQTVILDFIGIKWPHISVATLIKQ